MNFTKQMQKYADEFYEETGKTMASTREMAQWAIKTGRWQRQDEVALKQCAEDFARAMREDYTTDSKGRRVRRKHAASLEKDGKQITIWADSEYAGREFMEVAFKQRRNQIVGDCYQLKMDVDSYNENYNKGEQILIPFDFTPDMEELDQGRGEELS